MTTTGTGKASIAGSSRTWWNGGTGEGSLTAANRASVSHTENGNRTSSATLATDWVFAGGGWQEQETVFDTSGASKGNFASAYSISWQPSGSLDEASVDNPYSDGSLVQSATESHDYTSSSKMTRAALAGGGYAVTGWRTGGGESHGTSSVHYRRRDLWPTEESESLNADDSFDYTGDTWRIEFGETGMPSITYAGTLDTSEEFSTSASVNLGGWRGIRTDGFAFSDSDSRTRSAVTDAAPGLAISGGRELPSNGFSGTRLASVWGGYGNSFHVDGAGYGYDESRTMPAAFGGGAPEAATPPETPTGASVVPKGINSEATNYEARLAGLTSPRLVTSGSRPLGAGSANLPTMPTLTTPAIGALGFTKSDSAPETPQTRAFASLVTSGMAAPVGAMAASGSGGFDYDTFSAWAHTGLSVGGAVPAFGIVPDAIDFVLTAAEIPFGKSTSADLGFATAGLAATFLPVLADGPAAAAKIAARAARNADEAIDAAKGVVSFADELSVSAEAARRHLRRSVPGTNGQAHHIVPFQLRDHEIVQRASRGGFNINGVNNGIRLDLSQHLGSHPKYTSAVSTKLDEMLRLNPNVSDRDAASLIQTYVEQLRAGLEQSTSMLH